MSEGSRKMVRIYSTFRSLNHQIQAIYCKYNYNGKESGMILGWEKLEFSDAFIVS